MHRLILSSNSIVVHRFVRPQLREINHSSAIWLLSFLFLLVFSIRLQESLLGEVNRVRVVDNQWSGGVTVAGVRISLSSKPKIVNIESPPIDISYLSEDRALSSSSVSAL